LLETCVVLFRHDHGNMQNCRFLYTVHMPGNKYNCSPVTPRTRLERLLRERELRKSNQSFQSSEEARDSNRDAEILVNDSRSHENVNLGLPSEGAFLNGVAAARAFLADGCQRQDGRPSKQRLLVVANRLPVSAIRKGEDSWQLEMSVGGLVSALLGK
jgi:trehalose 6-phosphate synthase/phosphatase